MSFRSQPRNRIASYAPQSPILQKVRSLNLARHGWAFAGDSDSIRSLSWLVHKFSSVPIFKQIWFRPTAEFGFGEVSKIFSINADLAYYLPFAGVGKDSKSRYNVYVGGGPAYTLARRDFEGFPDQPVEDVDSDWESEVGLNLIFGVAQSSGWFAELRASAYNSPAVRLYVGYVFR